MKMIVTHLDYDPGNSYIVLLKLTKRLQFDLGVTLVDWVLTATNGYAPTSLQQVDYYIVPNDININNMNAIQTKNI
uniref:Uncharacterized protein n=1 Tax=Anopheles albimanus TaxID=7167 RepID=A0A182F3U4_ANOAL